MMIIAADFKRDMDRVIDYVNLSVATFDLAKASTSRFRSSHPLAIAARDVHGQVRALTTMGLSLACEGAYLSACAQFEQAVRDVIEEAVMQSIAKKVQFALLPIKMQEHHISGCGIILQNLRQDRFRHLNMQAIISSLYECVSPGETPVSLVVEAYSSNERNFKPKILSEHFKKLGVTKLWNLLGQDPSVQNHFETTSAADAERFAMERLERIMDKRNNIIHRNSSFTAPSDVEAKESATFFTAVIEGLCRTMTAHVASL